MKVIIDAHALFWYLIPNQKLPARTSRVLEDAEQICIPTIVLLEIFYFMSKLKLVKQYPRIIKTIKSSNKYEVLSLDLEIVQRITKVKNNMEMHDNIIVASAESLDIPLVTRDPQIQEVYKNTIW